MLQLNNEVREGPRWELIVRDEQINGWITSDLPRKFPEALPDDVQEPRVAFQEGKVLVACRLSTPISTTVLSLEMEPYLTDQPQQIAIRITRLRAGRLPLPLKRTLERLSAAAAKAGLGLQSSQDAGKPVAVVRLPTDSGKPPRNVALESLQVQNGQLSAHGRMVRSARPGSLASDRLSRYGVPVRPGAHG